MSESYGTEVIAFHRFPLM